MVRGGDEPGDLAGVLAENPRRVQLNLLRDLSANDLAEALADGNLDVVIGNAAGIQLVVNGSDLGAPGQPGEVLKLSFRPGDPDGSAG